LEIAAEFPDQIEILRCDVADLESIRAARDLVSSQTSGIDLLINNAGLGGLEALEEVDMSRGMRLFAVNAVAPIVVAREFLELLRSGERPLVVQMSSTMGSIAIKENEFGRWVDGYVYPGTKAALNIMSRQLYKDLKPEGIIVICQSPGWVQTDMGGSEAPLDVDECAESMSTLWDSLTLEDSGKYLTETGDELPYG
jgi:NAD(P)-dependent dehydrogenase (short-subunit alcohol dehydrogenase family)